MDQTPAQPTPLQTFLGKGSSTAPAADTSSTMPSGLPDTLSDTQIRSAIDQFAQQGAPQDIVQKFVDNYQGDGKGGYTLKGSQVQAQQTFGNQAPTQTPSLDKGGFLGKVADFLGSGKLGQRIGFEAGNAIFGDNQGAVDAAAQSGEIEQKLAAQIQSDKESGKDTTRLENALSALRNDHAAEDQANAEFHTGGVSNKEAIGSAVSTAASLVPVGEVAGAAEKAIAPVLGKAAPIVSKVATGAATGYGIDVGAKLQDENKTVGKSFVPGGATVIGGAIPGAAELISKAADVLPNWFVQKALPKLDSGNLDFATKNLSAGTVASNLEKSNVAVKSSGSAIQAVLSHPQYAGETGDIGSVLKDTLNKYPNAQLNDEKVANVIKKVAPLQKDLVDKVMDGTANLAQQNQLRQTLDKAVYAKFTDTPSLTANKQLAKVFADSLRVNVQGTAKETVPMFEQFSKELDLNKALGAAKTKLDKGSAVGLYDILSGIGGYGAGMIHGGSLAGPIGASFLIGAEKLARSPGTQITAAKALDTVASKASTPEGQALIRAGGKVIRQAASKTTQ